MKFSFDMTEEMVIAGVAALLDATDAPASEVVRKVYQAVMEVDDRDL